MFRGSREKRSIQLLFHFLFIVIVVFITGGFFIKADGRLDRIVAQEHFGVLVQIIETSGFRPEQPLKGQQQLISNTNYMGITRNLYKEKLLTSQGERSGEFWGVFQQKGHHEENEPAN